MVGLADEGVAAQIEALHLLDQVEESLIRCDFVIGDVDGGEEGGALSEVLERCEVGEVVFAQGYILQHSAFA